MDKNLIIVGIDPGTTTGIAILDIYGRVLAISSIRGAHFSELIEKVFVYGDLIAIGTDKKTIPQLISRFAAKTGCKIFSPKQDLGKAEKQKLVLGHDVKSHAADALAAALFAFSELKPLIAKIERFLEEDKKSYLFEDVVKLVILKEMAIKRAIDLIEQPKSEVERIIKKSKEMQKIENRKERGMLPFRSKPLFADAQKLSVPHFKYKKIETKKLKEKIKEMNKFISNLGNRKLLKKIDNLSYGEILKKDYLNIKEGDVLLVGDATVFDKDAVNFLKNKVSIAVCKKMPRAELPFVVIDARKLKITEIDDFASVDKKELENIRKEFSILKKIISEYKKEREAQ